jgi:hypothetical protein
MYSGPCQPRANPTVWTGQRTETRVTKRASWPASPRSNYKQQVLEPRRASISGSLLTRVMMYVGERCAARRGVNR